jgi:hypothetical protein
MGDFVFEACVEGDFGNKALELRRSGLSKWRYLCASLANKVVEIVEYVLLQLRLK